MKISNDRTLKALQADFQKEFPFLKIEFYKTPHKYGEETTGEDALNPDLLLSEVRTINNYGFMTLDGGQTTSEFENMLAIIYGLNVQVFRKSYGKWLQTWATDNWTLQAQNDRSAIMGEKNYRKPKNKDQRKNDKIFS